MCFSGISLTSGSQLGSVKASGALTAAIQWDAGIHWHPFTLASSCCSTCLGKSTVIILDSTSMPNIPLFSRCCIPKDVVMRNGSIRLTIGFINGTKLCLLKPSRTFSSWVGNCFVWGSALEHRRENRTSIYKHVLIKCSEITLYSCQCGRPSPFIMLYRCCLGGS